MFNTSKRQFVELENYRKKTNAINFAEGVLIGSLVGIGIGLLLAPRSGKETMDSIEEKTKEVFEKSVNTLSFKNCCKKKKNELESENVIIEDFEEETTEE